MHLALNKKIGFFSFYIIMAIILEIATFLIMGLGFFPNYFVYDLSILLLLGGIIFIIPNYTAQFVVAMFLLTLQIVLCYVNTTLYGLYGDIFSIDMINLFGEATKAITSDFTSFTFIIVLVALWVVVFLIGQTIYNSKKHNKIMFRKNFSLIVVIVMLIIQCSGFATYMLEKKDILATSTIYDENYVLSDSFLLETNILKYKSFKKFGTFGFYANSIAVLLSNAQKEQKAFFAQADQYLASGNIYNDSDVNGVNADNNLMMIMMESLEWFTFSNGEFESWLFDSGAINEIYDMSSTLTPTLNTLINESFIAQNNFSKNKTNISEGVAIAGSYPVGKLLTQVAGKTYKTSKNYYDFTLPNILNEKGYITTYFHSYMSNFYSRETTHKNLGFQNIKFYDSYHNDNYDFGNWKSEKEIVEETIDDLIPSTTEKFFTFYTTLSTHGPYDDNPRNAEQNEHRELVLASSWYANLVNDYPELTEEQITRLVNFECGVVGLDKAVKVIVDKLKADGIYDKTDIVFYADHDCYYHNNSNNIKRIESTEYQNYELNRVPMFIKSKNLSERLTTLGYNNFSTRFCSAYDILPTVLDLFGINFNENYYIGNSLFKALSASADGEDIVAYFSHTGGIFSKKYWTKDIVEFEKLDDSASEEYRSVFAQSCSELVKKISYVNTLYMHKPAI